MTFKIFIWRGHFSILFIALLFSLSNCVEKNPLVKKLEYSDDDVILIIHSDDLGLSKSHNDATVLAMTEGSVNSASIMMPCSWSKNAIDLLGNYKDLDIGVHLTFTNEWFNYKWGTVSPSHKVTSLVDKNGFMYPNCTEFAKFAKPEEVETEMRAQIEAAINSGINISHLDAHMSCIFRGRPEFIASYIKLAKEFGVVPMISRDIMKNIIRKNDHIFGEFNIDQIPYVDEVLIASEKEYLKKGMAELYTDMINNLKPGINVLLIHTSYEDEEMQIITEGHEFWNSIWRNDDFEFFTSETVKTIIKEKNIKLITWKEIQEKTIE